MSAKTDALEAAVTELIAAHAALEAAPGAPRRAHVDRAFARLAALAAPRIGYFIARYGLAGVADDARQVCAIALHRAAAAYDPRRARFTTFVNWQLRSELQALRLRLFGDRRRAGRRYVAATLSLDALAEDDPALFDALLADPDAEDATSAPAAVHLAECAADRLADAWTVRRRAAMTPARACRPGTLPVAAIERMEERLAAERALVRRQLTALVPPGAERLRESDRHIVRRAFADIGHHAGLAKAHRAARSTG